MPNNKEQSDMLLQEEVKLAPEQKEEIGAKKYVEKTPAQIAEEEALANLKKEYQEARKAKDQAKVEELSLKLAEMLNIKIDPEKEKRAKEFKALKEEYKAAQKLGDEAKVNEIAVKLKEVL